MAYGVVYLIVSLFVFRFLLTRDTNPTFQQVFLASFLWPLSFIFALSLYVGGKE